MWVAADRNWMVLGMSSPYLWGCSHYTVDSTSTRNPFKNRKYRTQTTCPVRPQYSAPLLFYCVVLELCYLLAGWAAWDPGAGWVAGEQPGARQHRRHPFHALHKVSTQQLLLILKGVHLAWLNPDPYWIRIQSGQWIRIWICIRNPDFKVGFFVGARISKPLNFKDSSNPCIFRRNSLYRGKTISFPKKKSPIMREPYILCSVSHK